MDPRLARGETSTEKSRDMASGEIIQIYPVLPPKTKLYCYFKAICSECGSYHCYRKFGGWQKDRFIAKCFKEKLIEDNKLELTVQPAPPKRRPHTKKKAVWPKDAIKAPTRGDQLPLFKESGQQMTIEEVDSENSHN